MTPNPKSAKLCRAVDAIRGAYARLPTNVADQAEAGLQDLLDVLIEDNQKLIALRQQMIAAQEEQLRLTRQLIWANERLIALGEREGS